MTRAETGPPYGPFVVHASTPASTPCRPPSQTSIEIVSAQQSLGPTVFLVIDFVCALIDASMNECREWRSTLRRRAVRDVVHPEIPSAGEAHRHRGRGPGPSGGSREDGRRSAGVHG